MFLKQQFVFNVSLHVSQSSGQLSFSLEGANTFDDGILLKRFIDDIFASLVCPDMDADKSLKICNGLNDAIKFNIKKPNTDNQLPFLDTLVSFDERTSKRN